MIPDATKRMEAALKRLVAAIMAGDADSVMRNFADDAAVYTSEDPLHGQDAIRAGIESFINNTPEGRGQFRGHAPDIGGDVAYITWKVEPFVLMATETFVVTDDKIRVQTYLIVELRSG